MSQIICVDVSCLGEFFIILKWYEGLVFDILWALQEMTSFMFKFPVLFSFFLNTLIIRSFFSW